MNTTSSHVCIATLGGQPQVVTLALDALISQGVPISEVIVVHLSTQNPRYQTALETLNREFTNDYYGGQPCRYRRVPIQLGTEPIIDLDSESTTDAVSNTLQNIIQQLKHQGRTVHLCIAGGRRLLGILALSTALLYFDHADRIWHLFSSDEVRKQTHEGALLHLPGHAGVRLVCIRIPPWGHLFPSLRPTTDLNVHALLDLQTSYMDSEERSRCQKVYNTLTQRQRDVLQAFAQGLDLQEVSDQLSITVATVHTHKSHIFQECCNAWSLPPDTRLNYRWLRDKFQNYFKAY
ncbi:MAG: histidine kinase [Blastochloris sp.]|nr:histidine kinase [Blastochloris sp.]